MDNAAEVKLVPESEAFASYDLEREMYDLTAAADILSPNADTADYVIAASSGLISGMIDILWVKEFDLARGRKLADEKVNSFVKRVAKAFGCKSDDIGDCVKHLEKLFPLPSDGNTADLGGGLQHHLRDFAHHPTVVGLFFSLLTQFTEKSYGTDKDGIFRIYPVPEKSRIFIGQDTAQKIINGTIVWFFHLVSDAAGSSSTAGLSGGTGIPGPVLSLAKELSVLPPFNKMKIGDDSVSAVLAKLFNGTLFMKRDENKNIIKESVIKFDLRGELGAAYELSRQAVPVIANECIVRVFYFLRRLVIEIRSSIEGKTSGFNWKNVIPRNSVTLDRMLTVSTGVFTAVDISEAVITKKERFWVSVNYAGVCRFAVALGTEMVDILKVRDVKAIRKMYEKLWTDTPKIMDDETREKLGGALDIGKLCLTAEQTELLYNLELHLTVNDIKITDKYNKTAAKVKRAWFSEWKKYISVGFSAFVGDESAEMHWYSKKDFLQKIEESSPGEPWLRLILLEALVFEPYFPLTTVRDKKNRETVSKKYNILHTPLTCCNKKEAAKFLEEFLAEKYGSENCIERFRKCYDNTVFALDERGKKIAVNLTLTAAAAAAAALTAGAAPAAAAAGAGASFFTGLGGTAAIGSSLAFAGSGVSSLIAEGAALLVCGGNTLGLGAAAAGTAGTILGMAGIMGKTAVMIQSAKLITAAKEIFICDENDTEFVTALYEQFTQNISDIEDAVFYAKLKCDEAEGAEKKSMERQIKNAERSVHVMKIAMKLLYKLIKDVPESSSDAPDADPIKG